ncbi:hypothetical protein [Alicyclobacillus sp. ALC3]|uniref:hypothetical protein n=1 Tax=Alicyclobacillus sp. ALC3 TaxID=2796143 RepID=UPI002377FA5C|nr:hypothetical protein [Alicyclobacillus sp. ALC3]WDL97187.1 hypothetical protein JC200_00015 [Alicyclobacillus sp. ALC3]
MNRLTARGLTVVCVVSLCLNGYFAVRHFAQRSSDYHAMAMVPYYLSLALVSYTIEFNKKEYPNTHYQPGHTDLQMAYTAFQASNSLYGEYGYNTTSINGFLDQLRNSSDSSAYHDLVAIKPYLSNTFVKPSQIQPLFNAIADEYKNM